MSSFKRILVHEDTLARLRAIRDRISKAKGIYWVFHPGELLALVAEALRLLASIIDQAGVDVSGPSDGLHP